jgi:hypothetical protein
VGPATTLPKNQPCLGLIGSYSPVVVLLAFVCAPEEARNDCVKDAVGGTFPDGEELIAVGFFGV